MEYEKINDYSVLHRLMNAYYRDGADADTPQEEVDAIIELLYGMVTDGQIHGCLVKEGAEHIGFALWAVDEEGFAFSEIPGYGTILEIGLILACRGKGRGKALVTYVEERLQKQGVKGFYVSAYSPAQKFWAACGYTKTGKTASNDLPIMIKPID